MTPYLNKETRNFLALQEKQCQSSRLIHVPTNHYSHISLCVVKAIQLVSKLCHIMGTGCVFFSYDEQGANEERPGTFPFFLSFVQNIIDRNSCPYILQTNISVAPLSVDKRNRSNPCPLPLHSRFSLTFAWNLILIIFEFYLYQRLRLRSH